MSDALPLPPRPRLEQYQKRAKELVKLKKMGDREALRAWVADWIHLLVDRYDLTVMHPRPKDSAHRATLVAHATRHTLQRLLKHLDRDEDLPGGPGTLARAQFAIAREHGFASWPKFARHLEGLNRAQSPISAFEEAVDAIVSGDAATLERLLRNDPQLVRARSTREHGSTLLHYVSANGVEDFRQKTPPNIVEITQRLLSAGADVNAESDAYGGRSTTLGLTATSYHPEAAGVQLPLLELLIAHGAMIDGPDGASTVNSCLHNGRGEAALFLAERGARLDLEGAAGVGRLDLVKQYFTPNGKLRRSATQVQQLDGFAWACEFGRTNVVDFLLQNGIHVSAKLKHHGQTGLHWAASGGHQDTAKLLLDHGASAAIRDDRFAGTPLDWAIYGWGNAPARTVRRRRYPEVVALLVHAGARLDPDWYQNDPERQRAFKKSQSNRRMQAALRGQLAPP